MTDRKDMGADSGSRADASSQQVVSTEGFDPGRLAGLSFVLPYDDGGERLSVTHDSHSKHWSDQVVIRQYESDDRVLYVELADLDWLIGALKLVAIATTKPGRPGDSHD